MSVFPERFTPFLVVYGPNRKQAVESNEFSDIKAYTDTPLKEQITQNLKPEFAFEYATWHLLFFNERNTWKEYLQEV